MFELRNGEKFAFFLLSARHLDSHLPKNQQLESNLWVMDKFPLELDNFWKNRLGEFIIEDIQDSPLCIATKCETKKPEALDEENENLKKHVRSFLLGLLLSGYSHYSNRNILLSGSMIDDKPNVRSVNFEEFPIYQAGSPFDKIDVQRLELSKNIANALDKFELQNRRNGSRTHKRIFRALHAYHSALHEEDLGERLHQFIRSIEGILLLKPREGKKQFSKKSELFLGNKLHEFSTELYTLRCVIEHLYGPYYFEGSTPQREYRLKIWQRILECEAFARYCISSFILNERIWPFFKDEDSIREFWDLSDREKRELWGKEFELKQITDRLLLHVVEDSQLLL